MEAVAGAHLYGRRLVLEWAEEEGGLDELRAKTAAKYRGEEELAGVAAAGEGPAGAARGGAKRAAGAAKGAAAAQGGVGGRGGKGGAQQLLPVEEDRPAKRQRKSK